MLFVENPLSSGRHCPGAASGRHQSPRAVAPMIPTIVIFGIVLALAAAVAWRLSTERARPPLFPHAEWPVGLRGDLPSIPDDLRASHSGTNSTEA